MSCLQAAQRTEGRPSEAFMRGARKMVAIHRMIEAGADESPEGDAIHDSIDASLATMNCAEKQRLCQFSADLWAGRSNPSNPPKPGNYRLFAPGDCVFVAGPDCNGDDQWVGHAFRVRVVSDVDHAVTLHGLSPWFPARSLVYLGKVPCKPLDSPRSRLRSPADNPGSRMDRWYKRIARRVLDGIRRRAGLLMLSPGFWLFVRCLTAAVVVAGYVALSLIGGWK